MQTPRRFLPPTAQLAAFEAVARTLSMTEAARELALTQSAVSRQIRALEDQLGAQLFTRDHPALRLTAGGEAYAREIRDALRRIGQATLALRANPDGGTLTLAILPTFGTRWLAPRLPGFLSAHTGVQLNLVTRLNRFDFAAETVDAAIHFGQADWPGTDQAFLRDETVVPVAAPELVARLQIGSPEALPAAPLLHLASRPDAWETWLTTYGVAYSAVRGMLFDQFATLAQAAISGLGIALLPRFLFHDELAQGRLCVVLDRPMTSRGSYWLCWPPDRASYPPLVAFRGWLQTAIADDPRADL